MITGDEIKETTKEKPILIVDDEPTSLNLLSKIVESIGFPAISADNGKAALKILNENPHIQFIFTDYKMPVMDGPSMIKAIHRNNKLKNIPIVLISGKVGFKEAGALLSKGVKGFMEKPIFKDDIKNILTQFTAVPREDEEESESR